jgi:AcrR family transcriptional regulator
MAVVREKRRMSKPGPVKRDVKADVMRAARKALLESGPRGAKSADIAEAAGVSQTTMFAHFDGGMAGVLAAAYDDAWGEICDFLMRTSFEEPSLGDPIQELVEEVVRLGRLSDDESLREAAEIALIYFRRPQALGSSVESANQERFEQRIERLCDLVVQSRGGDAATARRLRMLLINFEASWFFAKLFSVGDVAIDPEELRLEVTSQVFLAVSGPQLASLVDQLGIA